MSKKLFWEPAGKRVRQGGPALAADHLQAPPPPHFPPGSGYYVETRSLTFILYMQELSYLSLLYTHLS